MSLVLRVRKQVAKRLSSASVQLFAIVFDFVGDGGCCVWWDLSMLCNDGTDGCRGVEDYGRCGCRNEVEVKW